MALYKCVCLIAFIPAGSSINYPVYISYLEYITYIFNNNNDLMKGDINMDKKLTDEQLEELALEARRKYHREWRRNNPDKVREYRRRHWRKKALEMLKEQQEDA